METSFNSEGGFTPTAPHVILARRSINTDSPKNRIVGNNSGVYCISVDIINNHIAMRFYTL